MKKSLSLTVFVACSLLTLTATLRAVPITIGFDDLPDGTHVDNQYAGLGVVFTTGIANPLDTRTPDWIEHPGYPGSALPGGVVFESYCNTAEYVQANFTVPVDSVSIQMQPFEANTYEYGLLLYDASSSLLGGITMSGVTVLSSWSSIDPNELVTLGVQTPSADVAYARFYGYYGGSGGVNSVSFDNFTFNTATVPDGGTTMLLLGSALTGLAGLRRKLRK